MLDKYGVGGEVAVDDRGGARMQVTVTNIIVNGKSPPRWFLLQILGLDSLESLHITHSPSQLWASEGKPCSSSRLIRANIT